MEIANEIMEIIHQDNKIIDDLKEENLRLKSENQELITIINQLVEEHCSLTEKVLNGQEITKKRFERLLNEVFENKKI